MALWYPTILTVVKPPMSNRVFALNFFVPLIHKVVSVYAPIPSLCSDGEYRTLTTCSYINIFYPIKIVLSTIIIIKKAEI